MPRKHKGNRGNDMSPRGRGQSFSRGRGKGTSRNLTRDLQDDAMDFVIQQWPENNNQFSSSRGGRGRGMTSGYGSPRGNGKRGRGFNPQSYNTPDRNMTSRDSGRGRDRKPQHLPSTAPLSKHFFADRPLLKPVIFVRSVYTATLFQEEEQILQNVVEEIDEREESHVPTAERVNRVFNGVTSDRLSSVDESEELEEIDFHDLARVRAEVDAAPPKPPKKPVAEQQFTGFYIDTTPSLEAPPTAPGLESVEIQLSQISIDAPTPNDADMGAKETDLFYIDTAPTAVPAEIAPKSLPRISTPPINLPVDDDDIIVYVPPHPRHGSQPSPLVPRSNIPSTPKLAVAPTLPIAPAHESISFSFASSPAPKLAERRHAPVFTPRERRRTNLRQRMREAKANKKRPRGSFGNYGAIMSEFHLHDEDPKFDERRRGDSDIDWGDEDEEEGDGRAEGMQLDDELELDEDAMQGFVDGISAKGGQWVGSHDIEDAQRIKAEDEEDDESGTSNLSSSEDEDEADAVLDIEERMLVGEASETEEVTDSSDDDAIDASPQSNFKSRLERLRKNARNKKIRDSPPTSDDEDEFGTWANQDDDFIAEIEDILDENESILTGRDRKQRNRLFRAVRDGDFDDDMDDMMIPAKKNKDKGDDLPQALKNLWNKDRAKKAERKRLREQAKLIIASDPLSFKKGGKKGKKAMLAAARLSPTNPISVLPNRIMSMLSLEQQIRRFLQELDGPTNMTLPPMDKATRKQVHQMAIAFNLKSISKGKGNARYTTLIKTTRSGININERKVSKIAKSGRGWSAPGDWNDRHGQNKGKERTGAAPKHRDGEVIGKTAPKIGQSNIGFQMLASMGWSEGDRIGISGGLDAPLTAIIKNTKLGLGATR